MFPSCCLLPPLLHDVEYLFFPFASWVLLSVALGDSLLFHPLARFLLTCCFLPLFMPPGGHGLLMPLHHPGVPRHPILVFFAAVRHIVVPIPKGAALPGTTRGLKICKNRLSTVLTSFAWGGLGPGPQPL